MENWKLQDAKARFSEVVKKATSSGPQAITLRGKPAVVVISMEDYDKFIKPKPSFVDFIRHSPLMNTEFKIDRDSLSAR